MSELLQMLALIAFIGFVLWLWIASVIGENERKFNEVWQRFLEGESQSFPKPGKGSK